MRRLDCGTVGEERSARAIEWAELELEPVWRSVVKALSGAPGPRPVQHASLHEHRILESRKNLVVSAPTNAGKSLVGDLVLLDAIRRGGRAVLLEPLRALARERRDDLKRAARQLESVLGRRFSVQISTGDYRLEDEVLQTAPPDTGELFVATPERLEAVIRNPENDGWIDSIGAVCVDEAHLIATPRRGPTLELLVTSLLCRPAPPRIAMLSATLGDLGRVEEWLSPCDVVRVTERWPALHQEVWALEPDDDPDALITEHAREVLRDDGASLLVFVYQTRSTLKLAALLTEQLGPLVGSEGACAYHSKLSNAQRSHARSAFVSGQSRVIVATTALGLGVNLPATHVVVRDTVFPGEGPLGVEELLQMMGRAGRGDQPGHAAALVRLGAGRSAEQLAARLQAQELPQFVSAFEHSERNRRRRTSDDADTPSAATVTASVLARCPTDGMSDDQLGRFLERSLAGPALVRAAQVGLHWLSDFQRVLAHRDDEGRYRLTTLGAKATRAVFPLHVAAGFAQLIRDLLAIDDADRLLGGWSPLDHLVLLELLEPQRSLTLRYSQRLADHVDGWIEATPGSPSLLFREWIMGAKGGSRADELLGSLGVSIAKKGEGPEGARRVAYQAVFRAIVLTELGQGKPIDALERRWDLEHLAGVEERWRDTLLWLLSGLAAVLDVRCFFYFLREECSATDERMARVRRALRRMRKQTFELREELKFCSPLGLCRSS